MTVESVLVRPQGLRPRVRAPLAMPLIITAINNKPDSQQF